MGTVVLVKIIPLIDNRLARVFRWLVAFGLIHAIHEWVGMFRIMGYTEPDLTVISTFTVALSFAVLLQFGLEFISIKRNLSIPIRIIPAIVFMLWFVFYLKAFSYEYGMRLAEIGARYSLGFLGTFLTAYALIHERKKIAKSSYISENLLFAGIFFGLYGIFTIVVPDSDFFPASVFNYSGFTALTGVPVQIFRMLSAVMITGFIVRSLDVFNALEKKKLSDQVKEITGALEESEEEFHSLVENSPDIIIIASIQGTIRFINRTVPGFSIEKVIGTSIYDYVPKEHHAIMKNCMESVCQTKEPDSYEIIGKGPHDTMAWYSTRIIPVKQNDKVVALTFVSTDITKRKQVEEKIERNYQTQNALNAL
ncbi:MAG: PAS domain S-box protein, partial [Simkaniaceae bacterium]|nr:PAS domain S-box protein [Simkaniaceae bacterium]